METSRRPKSLNFADAAESCLRHMTLNYDADHDYVPYVGVTLGEKNHILFIIVWIGARYCPMQFMGKYVHVISAEVRKE